MVEIPNGFGPSINNIEGAQIIKQEPPQENAKPTEQIGQDLNTIINDMDYLMSDVSKEDYSTHNNETKLSGVDLAKREQDLETVWIKLLVFLKQDENKLVLEFRDNPRRVLDNISSALRDQGVARKDLDPILTKFLRLKQTQLPQERLEDLKHQEKRAFEEHKQLQQASENAPKDSELRVAVDKSYDKWQEINRKLTELGGKKNE